MLLINFEIILMLTQSKNCFIVAGNAAKQESTFTLTDAKLYVPDVNLPTH